MIVNKFSDIRNHTPRAKDSAKKGSDDMNSGNIDLALVQLVNHKVDEYVRDVLLSNFFRIF